MKLEDLHSKRKGSFGGYDKRRKEYKKRREIFSNVHIILKLGNIINIILKPTNTHLKGVIDTFRRTIYLYFSLRYYIIRNVSQNNK